MMTLTGTLADHTGEPLAKTTIIITPTPSETTDPDARVVRLGGREVTTDETGFFTTELGTAPGLWYTVRSTAGGRLRPRRFRAETPGDVVDLSDPDRFPVSAPSPMTEYVRGASTYELWLAEGNEGTVEDFLTAQQGPKGEPGAYALTPTATPGVLQIGASQ